MAQSIEEDCFDVQNLLCEEQRVKVRFLQNTPWTGVLALAEDGEHDSFIAKGTVLMIPLWLARTLQEHGTIQILPPRQFGPRIRDDLIADAMTVNLHEISPYWYELGSKLSKLLPEEGIARMMRGTMVERMKLLARSTVSTDIINGKMGDGGADPHKTIFGVMGPMSRMDATEKTIYSACVKAKTDSERWLNGDDEGRHTVRSIH